MSSPQVLGPGIVNLIGVSNGNAVYLAVLNLADCEPAIVLSHCQLPLSSVEAVIECLAMLPAEKFGAGRSVDLAGDGTPGLAALSPAASELVGQLQSQGGLVLLN